MKLYAGTTEQFRADAQMHRIAEKLRAEYTTQIGHKPSPNEVASWQNSLMSLKLLLDQAELNDHGVILAVVGLRGSASRRKGSPGPVRDATSLRGRTAGPQR